MPPPGMPMMPGGAPPNMTKRDEKKEKKRKEKDKDKDKDEGKEKKKKNAKESKDAGKAADTPAPDPPAAPEAKSPAAAPAPVRVAKRDPRVHTTAKDRGNTTNIPVAKDVKQNTPEEGKKLKKKREANIDAYD